MVPTKNKLEKIQKAQQLQEKVNARRGPEDMIDQGYLTNDPTKLHGSLHESADQLSKNLEQKSDKEWLERTHVLKRTNMADSLQPNAQNVEDKLQNRSPRDTITQFKTPLQATAEHVDRLKKEANVKRQLNDRSDKDQLTRSGVLKSTAAPALHAPMGQLDKQMKTDHVKQELTDRSTASELSDANIMKSTIMAPAIQPAAVSLERNIKSDHVSQDMKDRPTRDQLQAQNVLKQTNLVCFKDTMHACEVEREREREKCFNCVFVCC